MSIPGGENLSLPEFEAEVMAELAMAEASHPEEAMNLPVTEWLFDPVDVERDEVGLRNLLGAVEALEVPPPTPQARNVDHHGGDRPLE